MTILLDVNVLLDVVLAREPWAEAAKQVADACAAGKVAGCVSAATIPILFYVVRRASNLDAAFRTVDQCLNSFEIVPLDRGSFEYARTLGGSDFEDNIQIACAVHRSVAYIVTRDTDGYRQSPV